MTKAAKKYKDVDFAIVDAVVDLPNVTSLVFNEHEASYLAGVAAALKSKSDHIGFIGGTDSVLIKKFAGGFEQGIKDTNPRPSWTSSGSRRATTRPASASPTAARRSPRACSPATST